MEEIANRRILNSTKVGRKVKFFFFVSGSFLQLFFTSTPREARRCYDASRKKNYKCSGGGVHGRRFSIIIISLHLFSLSHTLGRATGGCEEQIAQDNDKVYRVWEIPRVLFAFGNFRFWSIQRETDIGAVTFEEISILGTI